MTYHESSDDDLEPKAGHNKFRHKFDIGVIRSTSVKAGVGYYPRSYRNINSRSLLIHGYTLLISCIYTNTKSIRYRLRSKRFSACKQLYKTPSGKRKRTQRKRNSTRCLLPNGRLRFEGGLPTSVLLQAGLKARGQRRRFPISMARGQRREPVFASDAERNLTIKTFPQFQTQSFLSTFTVPKTIHNLKLSTIYARSLSVF